MVLDANRSNTLQLRAISIIGAGVAVLAVIGYLLMKSDRKNPKKKASANVVTTRPPPEPISSSSSSDTIDTSAAISERVTTTTTTAIASPSVVATLETIAEQEQQRDQQLSKQVDEEDQEQQKNDNNNNSSSSVSSSSSDAMNTSSASVLSNISQSSISASVDDLLPPLPPASASASLPSQPTSVEESSVPLDDNKSSNDVQSPTIAASEETKEEPAPPVQQQHESHIDKHSETSSDSGNDHQSDSFTKENDGGVVVGGGGTDDATLAVTAKTAETIEPQPVSTEHVDTTEQHEQDETSVAIKNQEGEEKEQAMIEDENTSTAASTAASTPPPAQPPATVAPPASANQRNTLPSTTTTTTATTAKTSTINGKQGGKHLAQVTSTPTTMPKSFSSMTISSNSNNNNNNANNKRPHRNSKFAAVANSHVHNNSIGGVTSKSKALADAQSSSSSSAAASTSMTSSKSFDQLKPKVDAADLIVPKDMVVYEFNFPRSLCGKLIGKNGFNVDAIRTKTRTQIAVRSDPHAAAADEQQIVCVSGCLEDVDAAIDMIALMFPAKLYPHISFKPISKPIVYRRLIGANANSGANSANHTNGSSINKMAGGAFNGKSAKSSLHMSHVSESKILVAPNMFVDFASAAATEMATATATATSLPVDGMVSVNLTSIVNSAHVFIQLPTHPSYDSLCKLDEVMLAAYSPSDPKDQHEQQESKMIPMMSEPIDYGTLCVAPTSYGWHRTMVTSYQSRDDVLAIIPDYKEACGLATVKFLDYGGYLTIPVNQLRQLR